MITKIIMNNVASYKTSTSLETDKKVNLLYGLNGSGKSTLSNFLYNRSENKFVDCSIEGLKESDTILVYNQQFIRDNFYETEDIAGIFTLSKENKEIKELIDKAKNEISVIEKECEALETKKEAFFSEYEESLGDWQEKIWAIKDEFTGKDSVLAFCLDGLKSSKSKLFNYLIDREKVLEKTDYEIESLKLEAKELTSGDGKVSSINKIELVEDKLEKSELLEKVIVGNNNSTVADVIEELRNSDWVNKGMEFIDTNEDPSLCPFCQQKTISKEFIKEIEKYFDSSYQEDKEQVEFLLEEYIKQTSLIVDKVKKLKENRFLSHNLSDIEKLLILFESVINSNINIIKSKISTPSISVTLTSTQKFISQINTIIDQVNQRILEYNKKIDNIENSRGEIKEKFWKLMQKRFDNTISEYNKKKGENEAYIKEYDKKKSNFKEKKEKQQRIIKDNQKRLLILMKPLII